ncbi:hypothetical protein PARPLA_00351 [Rhodobacteraceae bacterium THAF1]|uniref:hypothetical protein n=1 Tax=Palleronia sp. THAF1 TaxID=2587842 RepID=UPI000F3D10C9|nr:hypothetical protein [Palleronia sp. THAF1]QFU10084.1 hypothetical protein FIU81_15505 [Palleronia sp. THAF1]VDC17011.1 hypothetical protein PARPLA_00351 [Rhodobacteraceae bacterium THAF1]
MAIARSAIFVTFPFAASFAVILLISRFYSGSELAGFFLFQAIFLPIVTLLSQVRSLISFLDMRAPAANAGLDVISVLLAIAALSLLGKELISAGAVALYALSIPLVAHGQAALASIQRRRQARRWAILPVAIAFGRVLVIWVAIKAETVEPAGPFLASVLVLVLPILLVRRIEAQDSPKTKPIALSDFGAMLTFFATGAVFFQIDKYVLAIFEAQTEIVLAGVVATLVLSPMSILFAIVYRADLASIYGSDNRDQPFRTALFTRSATRFITAGTGYIALLGLYWTPLTSTLFPVFSGSAIWPILMGAAVILDRIGLLTVYISGRSDMFRRASIAKFVLIALTIVLMLLSLQFFDLNLTHLFAAYLISSAIWLVQVWRLR